MANEENLRPVKKGDPGRNPNGRKKGSKNKKTEARELAELLNLVLESSSGESEVVDGEYVDVSNKKAIVYALVKEARKGNIPHIREVFDRTDGKPVQKSEVDINGGMDAFISASEELEND